MKARDLPEAIQWHEGMLLAPQHFQQLALREEELLHYHAQLLAPFHWGVRRLQIDPGMLVDGLFRVTELEAVMPDGLVVAYEPGTGEELALDLKLHADAMKQRPLAVHLGVTAKRLGGSPVKGELARYDSHDGEPVLDDNTGDGEMRIPRLRPRLALLAGDAPPRRFVSFPLAKVRYENETFVLSDFVAPVLRVPLDSPLGGLCAAIARRLREKAVFLADRARSPAVAARAPQLLETKAMIRSLVMALPAFEAVLATGTAHPYPLYLALCGVVGHVAGIGRALVPPAFAPYDHDDLYATFEQAREFIFRMIDEGIVESYTGFPFSLETGVFSLAFDELWRNRPLVLGVRAAPGVSERELAAWMDECLIGSKNRVPSMRDRRVLGANRTPIEGEGDLVPAGGVLLYALEAEPEFVENNQLLQVLNLGERAATQRPAEIVLYVKNRP